MSAIEQWDAAVEAETEKQLAKQGGIDPVKARQKAVVQVATRDPDLHRDYLREVNANRPNAPIHG